MFGEIARWLPGSKSIWIRVSVVTATLLLSALLGSRTASFSASGGMGAEIIVGGIVAVMLVFAAMRYMEFGVLALLFAAFFVRITLPTGTYSRIPSSMALAGLLVGVWIVWMFLRRQVALVSSSVNVPLIGFIVVAMLSYPWSWLSWRPEFFITESMTRFQVAQFGGLAVMILLPAVLLLALNILQDEKWVKRLFIMMVVIAAPELVQRLAQRSVQFAGVGISGPGLYHSWLVGLLYAQLLYNKGLNKWLRVFYSVLIAGWLFWGFVLKITWISGWMPSMVAILAITFMKSKRAVVFAFILMIIPFIVFGEYYYETVVEESVRDDSNRLWLWQTIIFDLTLTKAGLVLGAGPAGYTPYFMFYYPGLSMSAHNNYVDIIAETGIIGTIFFLWFLFEVFRTGWNQQTKIKDDFLLAFNNGVLGGFIAMLAAMMLDDWFIPFAYNNGLPGFEMNVYAWILLGAMLNLERLTQKSAANVGAVAAPAASHSNVVSLPH